MLSVLPSGLVSVFVYSMRALVRTVGQGVHQSEIQILGSAIVAQRDLFQETKFGAKRLPKYKAQCLKKGTQLLGRIIAIWNSKSDNNITQNLYESYL